jgi:hypothetical protein
MDDSSARSSELRHIGLQQQADIIPAWTAGGQQSLAALQHPEAGKQIFFGFQGVIGAPGTIRTSDPQIRSLFIYVAPCMRLSPAVAI